MTLHHAVADPAAALICLREILQSAGEPAEAGTRPAVEAGPVDERLPRGGSHAGFGLFKRPITLEPDRQPPPGDRVTRLRPIELLGAEAARLAQRCANEGVSAGAAAAAALLSALDRDLAERGRSGALIALGATASVRDQAGAAGEIGNYSATVYTAQRPAGRDPWALCREVHAAFDGAQARGEAAAAVRELAGIAPAGADQLGRFRAQVAKRAHSSVTLVDLGRLPLGDTAGPFAVRKLHVSRALPWFELVQLVVLQRQDQLVLDLLAAEGSLAPERIALLVERVSTAIRQFAS